MKLGTGVYSLYSLVIFIGLVFGLQACGGGGGGGGSTTPTPTPDANPTGYYTGSAAVKNPTDNNVDFAIDDIQIMISGSRIMIMSNAKAVLYDGTFTVIGNDLTSTVTVYYDGDKQTETATLNATITAGSQLTGSFSGTKLGNGSFESTYSSLNNTASSLTMFSNQSLSFSAGLNLFKGADIFEIDINDSDGEVTIVVLQEGGQFFNCDPVAPSSVLPISNTSLFAVSITFSGCSGGVNGLYTGLAQFKPGTTDILSLTMSNGVYSTADDLYHD